MKDKAVSGIIGVLGIMNPWIRKADSTDFRNNIRDSRNNNTSATSDQNRALLGTTNIAWGWGQPLPTTIRYWNMIQKKL